MSVTQGDIVVKVAVLIFSKKIKELDQLKAQAANEHIFRVTLK